MPPPASTQLPTRPLSPSPSPPVWLGKHQKPEITLSGIALQPLSKCWQQARAVLGNPGQPLASGVTSLNVPLWGMGAMVFLPHWGF